MAINNKKLNKLFINIKKIIKKLNKKQQHNNFDLDSFPL